MMRGIKEEAVIPASTPLPRAAAPIMPAIEESSASTHLRWMVSDDIKKTTLMFATHLGQYMSAREAV